MALLAEENAAECSQFKEGGMSAQKIILLPPHRACY
jgi:hypothetical protein